MELIAIANQKGRGGKTTTAVNFAAYLVLRDSHVQLIDLDSPGSSTTRYDPSDSSSSGTLGDKDLADEVAA
jgi:cellulose biosynthesis protein BcsQ